MNATNLAPEVLQASLLKSEFQHGRLVRVKEAMLRLALTVGTFDASQIDAVLCRNEDGSPDNHVAGVSIAALQSIGLIEATGERVRSSRADANGRRVNRYRLAPGKRVAALAWFAANNLPAPSERQMEIFA